VITTVGNAEAEKTLAVGTAEADVIKLKINSMESGNYAAVQIATALASKDGMDDPAELRRSPSLEGAYVDREPQGESGV
jgi:hypothetical protein